MEDRKDMKKNLFNKILGFFIIIIMLFFCCLNTVGLSQEKIEDDILMDNIAMTEEKKLTKVRTNEPVFDWPMFHHDIRHTGYTDGIGDIKDSPKLKWSYKTGGFVRSSTAIADIDNDSQMDVFATSFDSNIYMLNGLDGNEEWRFPTQYQIWSSPALGDIDNDGNIEVVFGSDDFKVYALDALSEVKWIYNEADNFVPSSPAIGDIDNDGKMEVIVGSYDKKVHAIDGVSGENKWFCLTGGWLGSSPALGDIDNDSKMEVVIGSYDKNIYAINSAGGVKWIYPTDGVVYSSPALGDIDNDGQIEVVVGSHDNKIHVINGIDGSREWIFTTGFDVRSSPALGDIDNDGTIEFVVGSYDGNVYAVDGITRIEKWSSPIGSTACSPALCDIDNDGTIEVVVGADNNNVYSLDGLTGEIEWIFETGGWVSSPPAISDIDGDGFVEVVIGSWDSYIYALDGDEYLPGIIITSPGKNDYVSGTVKITGTAHSYDGIIETVDIKIDNNEWRSATLVDTTNWYYYWNTNEVDDGYHNVIARTKDDKGLEEESNLVRVLVDNTPPECVIERPFQGHSYENNIDKGETVDGSTRVKGKFQVWVEASDTNDIRMVEFYVNNELMEVEVKPDERWYKWWWDEKTGIGGKICTLKAVAEDNAGNRYQDEMDVFYYNFKIKALYPILRQLLIKI